MRHSIYDTRSWRDRFPTIAFNQRRRAFFRAKGQVLFARFCHALATIAFLRA
jgi:hypothetical protein